MCLCRSAGQGIPPVFQRRRQNSRSGKLGSFFDGGNRGDLEFLPASHFNPELWPKLYYSFPIQVLDAVGSRTRHLTASQSHELLEEALSYRTMPRSYTTMNGNRSHTGYHQGPGLVRLYPNAWQFQPAKAAPTIILVSPQNRRSDRIWTIGRLHKV